MRFQRQHRLTKTWQYRRVYDGGRRSRGRHVVAFALQAVGEPSRAGVVAGRKVGGAVERNRVKRRLKHVLRDLWMRVPGHDHQLVVIALPEAARADFESLRADVTDALEKLGVLLP